MCLAILENLLHLWVQGPAVFLDRGPNHANPTEWHDGAFERCICLQSDNLLQVPVNISGRMRGDVGDDLGVKGQDPACGAFLRPSGL